MTTSTRACVWCSADATARRRLAARLYVGMPMLTSGAGVVEGVVAGTAAER